MTTTAANVEEQTESDEQSTETVRSGASYDDINVPVILMVGVISTVVTICTIFFVQGLCYHWHNSFIRERSLEYVNEPVRAVVESQKAMLTGETEGVKSIDDTITEVVEKFGKK